MSRTAWVGITVLTCVVIILAVGLFLLPAPAEAPLTPQPAPLPTAEAPFTSENVKVTSPLPKASVPKTFTVSGQARGTWFFEASFPVQVRDKDNNKVGQGIAQAQSDWMTTDFVPFTTNITVTGYSGPATLVLLKDNPSGLPENEDAVSFPVVIAE